MSDTPRVDAELARGYIEGWVVSAVLARQLERELQLSDSKIEAQMDALASMTAAKNRAVLLLKVLESYHIPYLDHEPYRRAIKELEEV